MKVAALVSSLVGLTSCYGPNYGDGQLACGPNSSCPEGLTCAADGRCRRADAAAGQPDGPTVLDGALVDGRPIDGPRLDTPPGAPTVVSVTPAPGATNADPELPVRVVCSTPMDAASVIAALDLTRPDGRVAGTVSLGGGGSEAYFTPTRRLALRAEYTVTIAATATSAAGVALGVPYTSTFTVRDGVWGAQAGIANLRGNSVDVGSDAAGNALAVWVENDLNGFDVWWNRYTPAGGWGTPAILVQSGPGNNVFHVDLDVAPDGRAIAIWALNSNVTAARFDPTSGTWIEPFRLVSTNLRASYAPVVAIADGGLAFAAWPRSNGIGYSYSDAITWATERTATNGTTTGAESVRVDLNGTFGGIVWAQGGKIMGAPWTSGTVIAATDLGAGAWPDVAVDASGTLTAVWETLIAPSEVIAGRYVGFWQGARTLNASGAASGAAIAVNPAGAGIATWSQSDGTTTDAFAAVLGTDGTWAPAGAIESAAGSVQLVRAAIDPRGHGIVVWEHGETSNFFTIYASRLQAGTWTAAKVATTGAHAPAVAIAPDGTAMVVFEGEAKVSAVTFR